MRDYAELTKVLRYCSTHDCIYDDEIVHDCEARNCDIAPRECDTCNKILQWQAADAIEELIFERDKYKSFFDRIANLPDCNTCLKKRECEFVPRAGEHTRINCAFYVPDPREVKNE